MTSKHVRQQDRFTAEAPQDAEDAQRREREDRECFSAPPLRVCGVSAVKNLIVTGCLRVKLCCSIRTA